MSQILLSTAYFPPVDYMAMIGKGNSIIEVHESYSRQSYRNRCIIPAANGKIALILPIDDADKEIEKIKILYKEDWQKQHWKTIVSAYNNSPFFNFYSYRYEGFFSNKYELLFEFNSLILEQLCKDLGLEKPGKTTFWARSPENTEDFRNLIHPKKPSVLSIKPYYQVFSDKYGFTKNCSVLDLLFNLGPDAGEYLINIKKK